MKVVIKGIETHEDTRLAKEHGIDAVYVSNHGGRGIHSSRGALECLPEVVAAAGELPVMIDSGFRRGTDVFKALAMGATAVGIGRPYVWGLGAFGEAGVDRVIDLINTELRAAMVQAGARTVGDITSDMIVS
jgi:isopentenyl diphosphate isomerase/L-lactate dehydrogenase-like FMN-dependent dehydrogenase